MLVLFDVDATLISTSGVGIRALDRAGRRLHGPAFDASTTEYAGRLDPLIMADLLIANGIEPSVERIALLRQGYRAELEHELATPGVASILPGVATLLERLATVEGLVIGLLTGNYQDTGEVKLRACGVDLAPFIIRVWGDESPHVPPAREHLPLVALDRYHGHVGRALDPARGVVVGDTIHDISCARACGLRSIGVATGMYSLEQLAHADLAVRDLSETDAIASWIVAGGGGGA